MIRGVLPHPPRFLTLDEVLSLHETAIDAHGGSHGVRDHGLLESALAMAPQSFGGEFAHEVPFAMAAAYLFHVCKNHPFVDGNKRTALAACVVFLRLNGWELGASEEAAVEAVLNISTDVWNKAKAAEWLESACRPRPSIELRNFFRNLNYQALASTFAGVSAGSVEERVATILEASRAIPGIAEANNGALHAEELGDTQSAAILRTQGQLLTALYRIAEDMGYEW